MEFCDYFRISVGHLSAISSMSLESSFVRSRPICSTRCGIKHGPRNNKLGADGSNWKMASLAPSFLCSLYFFISNSNHLDRTRSVKEIDNIPSMMSIAEVKFPAEGDANSDSHSILTPSPSSGNMGQRPRLQGKRSRPPPPGGSKRKCKWHIHRLTVDGAWRCDVEFFDSSSSFLSP